MYSLHTYVIFIIYRLCVCKFAYLLKLFCNHNVNTCVLQSFGDIVACPGSMYMHRVAKSWSCPTRTVSAELIQAIL